MYPFGGCDTHDGWVTAYPGVLWSHDFVQRCRLVSVRQVCRQDPPPFLVPWPTLIFTGSFGAALSSASLLALCSMCPESATMQSPWALEVCMVPGPPSSRVAAFLLLCETAATPLPNVAVRQPLLSCNLLHCHTLPRWGSFFWLCAPKKGDRWLRAPLPQQALPLPGCSLSGDALSLLACSQRLLSCSSNPTASDIATRRFFFHRNSKRRGA